jgi:hypothetical protein
LNDDVESSHDVASSALHHFNSLTLNSAPESTPLAICPVDAAAVAGVTLRLLNARSATHASVIQSEDIFDFVCNQASRTSLTNPGLRVASAGDAGLGTDMNGKYFRH